MDQMTSTWTITSVSNMPPQNDALIRRPPRPGRGAPLTDAVADHTGRIASNGEKPNSLALRPRCVQTSK
jgi:hypothetical protein